MQFFRTKYCTILLVPTLNLNDKLPFYNPFLDDDLCRICFVHNIRCIVYIKLIKILTKI